MATKRVVRTEEEVELTPIEEEQEDRFTEILAELGQAGDSVYTAKVYQVPTHANGAAIRGSKEILIDEVDQSEIPGLAMRLRDEAGTGTYRIRLFCDGKIAKSADIRVRKLGENKKADNDNTTLIVLFQDIIKQQNERMEKLEQRIVSVPQVSEIDRLKTMSEIVKNLQPSAPTVAPAPSETATMANSVSLITTIFTMAEKIFKQPVTAPEGSSWQDVAVAFLQNGGVEALKQGNLVPARPNPAQSPKEIPSRPVQTEQIKPQPEYQVQSEKPNQDMIRIPIGNGQFFNIPAPIHARINETVITLCRRARANANDPDKSQPFAYVDFVLDELEEIDPSGSLSLQLVGNENSLALLGEAFPAILPYKAWFETLLMECSKAIAGGDESGFDGADTAPRQPNGTGSPDAQDHAPFDPRGEAESVCH